MSDDLRGWEFVCTEAELLPGEKKTVWHGDTPILVVNLDGVYYAVEDQCTHEDFELSAGEIDAERGEIECVLHGAKFDLRTRLHTGGQVPGQGGRRRYLDPRRPLRRRQVSKGQRNTEDFCC